MIYDFSVAQDEGSASKDRVKEYVDSTSGYHTLSDTPTTCHPHATDVMASAAEALILHEYCVPSCDAEHFITLFYFTKQALQKRLYATT